MYSAKIDGEPTTFGTSGLLYRSNKVMYDRATNSLWHQFTGEPIVGPLADSGIRLPFFPSVVTTWEEWLAEHPDTTVLSQETGLYPAFTYVPETDPRAIYHDYFSSPDTMFPVPDRSAALDTKQVVLGVSVGDVDKAYPIGALQIQRVVNDALGDAEIVVIASSVSEAARAYERDGRRFALSTGDSSDGGVPTELVDSDGVAWRVTEDSLVSSSDPSETLERLPTQNSFWFGWYSFHRDTLVYTLAARPRII